MRLVLFTTLFLLTINLAAQTLDKTVLLSQVMGNWYEPESNKWEYGFFEEFAIVNGEFWNYKTIQKTRKGYDVILSHMMHNPIKLSLQSKDSMISITRNKVRTNYRKVDQALPMYKTIDTTSFMDTKFGRLDSVTIIGYLRNNTSTDHFEIGIPNVFSSVLDYYYAPIDQWGRFEIKIPLLNTSQVLLDWKRSVIECVLTPGEKFFVFIDLKDKVTLYAGDNGRFHNELVSYLEYIDKSRIRKTDQEYESAYKYQRSLKGDDYLKFMLAEWDSLTLVNQAFVKDRSIAYRTSTYIKEKTRYKIARDLMQKKFQLNEKKGERFSDHYMHTVKSLFFDDNVKPVSLVEANRGFLRDFFQYYLSDETIRDQLGVVHDDIKFEFVSSGIIPVRTGIKTLAELEKKKNSIGFSRVDSLSLIDMYKDSLLTEEYESILTAHNDLMRRLTFARLSLLRPLDILCKEFPHDQDLIEVFHFGNIISQQKNNPIAYDDYIIDRIVERFHSPYLKERILASNREFVNTAQVLSKELPMETTVPLNVVEGSITYPQNIKNTDHLKGVEDVDKIIEEILAPHKGKVIYIDFWGLWCAPCIEGMKFVPALNKELKGKDVVLIYFANRTEKTAWVNFIKNSGLEGEQIMHYNLPSSQQTLLERKLGVTSFPTYMLVDKNGDFVNKNAPSPRDKDRLVRNIDSLLAK